MVTSNCSPHALRQSAAVFSVFLGQVKIQARIEKIYILAFCPKVARHVRPHVAALDTASLVGGEMNQAFVWAGQVGGWVMGFYL